MCGAVIVTIWPAYEGSVSTSWYPVMLVLNTTSPRASPAAPAATPRYQVPSSRTSMAFIETRRGALLLQRRGNARAAAGLHTDGRRPVLEARELHPHGVGSGAYRRDDQRGPADARSVHEHLGA